MVPDALCKEYLRWWIHRPPKVIKTSDVKCEISFSSEVLFCQLRIFWIKLVVVIVSNQMEFLQKLFPLPAFIIDIMILIQGMYSRSCLGNRFILCSHMQYILPSGSFLMFLVDKCIKLWRSRKWSLLKILFEKSGRVSHELKEFGQ